VKHNTFLEYARMCFLCMSYAYSVCVCVCSEDARNRGTHISDQEMRDIIMNFVIAGMGVLCVCALLTCFVCRQGHYRYACVYT